MSERIFEPERVFEAGSEGPAKQLEGKELEKWEEKQLREKLRKEHLDRARNTEWVQALLKVSKMPEEEWVEKMVEKKLEQIKRMRKEIKKEQEK